MPEAIKKANAADATETTWVSLNEATKLLRLNREAVLRLGVERLLTIQRMGRWTIVSRDSIEQYLAARTAQTK